MFVTGRCNKVSFPLCRFSQLHTHPCCAVTAALVTDGRTYGRQFLQQVFQKSDQLQEVTERSILVRGSKINPLLKVEALLFHIKP